MLIVETIAKIRRAFFVQKKPIKTICRELRVSRRVVRKVIRSQATEFRYERGRQPLPRIDPWRDPRWSVAGERRQAGARTVDADPDIRGATCRQLRGQLRRGSTVREGVARGTRRHDGRSLHLRLA